MPRNHWALRRNPRGILKSTAFPEPTESEIPSGADAPSPALDHTGVAGSLMKLLELSGARFIFGPSDARLAQW